MTTRKILPLADNPNAIRVKDTDGKRVILSAPDERSWRPLIQVLERIAARQCQSS